MDLAPYLEYTNLTSSITGTEVDQLVLEAGRKGLIGVCIPPFWVKRASREIGTKPISLISVVGFPLGFQMTETKMMETELALRDGAEELDVTLNFSAFTANMPWVKIELAKISKQIHQQQKAFKVIVNALEMLPKELLKSAKIAADAGADFVSANTGARPCEPEIVTYLRENLSANVGIKVAGLVEGRQQAIDLVNAGADRIGISALNDLVEGDGENNSL